MSCARVGLRVLVCFVSYITLISAAATRYGGTYYYIAPNGDDSNDGKTAGKPLKTFWHAQYVLAPGDILMVRGGTYRDQLFFPIVDGNSAKPITVQAYPGEKPVLTGHATWGAFFIISRPWWIFDGLTFENLLDGPYVLWVHDTHHLTFRNITIRNHPGDMMVVSGCEDVVIESSSFDTTGTPDGYGAGEHIYIAGSRRVLVQNNKFVRAGHASITVMDDNRYIGRPSGNNVIRNNVIEQHWGGGIYVVKNSYRNVIEGNRISYAGEQDLYPKAGMLVSSPENIVRRNVITNTGNPQQPLDNGLAMYAWDEGPARQNVLDNRVYNNVVYKSVNSGLFFFLLGESQAARNKFVNNVFYRNKLEVCNETGCGEGLEIAIDSFHTANKWASFPNGNYFFNNVILGAQSAADSPGLPVFYNDYERWTKSIPQLQEDYPAFFKGNMDQAPQFVNPDQGTFTLQATSKLIDSAMELTQTAGNGANTRWVKVEDARFFSDGFGLVSGDTIRVGSNPAVMIQLVDYATNTLTVARPISYLAGDPVNLPFSGNKPDVGAYEYTIR